MLSQLLTRLAILVDPNNFTGIPKTSAEPAQIQNVLQIIFGAAGVVAVLIITLGGIQYITSQGDSQKVAKAKDTILYAVIGLVIAISVEVILQFIVKWLG